MFSALLTSKPHGRPGCAARNGSWVRRATRIKYRKIPNKKEKEKGAYGGVKQNQMGTCGRSSQGTPSHLSLTALSLKRLKFNILSSTCNKNKTILLYLCNSATQKCLLIIFFWQSRGWLDPFPLNSPPLPMQSSTVTIRHSASCNSALQVSTAKASSCWWLRQTIPTPPSILSRPVTLLLRLTVLCWGAAVRGSSLLGPSLGMEASTSWAKLSHHPNPRTATSATWDPTLKLKPNSAHTSQGPTQSYNFGSFLGFYYDLLDLD